MWCWVIFCFFLPLTVLGVAFAVHRSLCFSPYTYQTYDRRTSTRKLQIILGDEKGIDGNIMNLFGTVITLMILRCDLNYHRFGNAIYNWDINYFNLKQCHRREEFKLPENIHKPGLLNVFNRRGHHRDGCERSWLGCSCRGHIRLVRVRDHSPWSHRMVFGRRWGCSSWPRRY